MKVLTVQQPWAWAIFHGKDVENRSQLFKYRGLLAIHAGARWSDRGAWSTLVTDAAKSAGMRTTAVSKVSPPLPLGTIVEERDFTFGSIIGVAELRDAHRAERGCCDSPWGEHATKSTVHLCLTDQLEFAEPIPDVRGKLGLWKPDDDLREAIEYAHQESM